LKHFTTGQKNKGWNFPPLVFTSGLALSSAKCTERHFLEHAHAPQSHFWQQHCVNEPASFLEQHASPAKTTPDIKNIANNDVNHNDFFMTDSFLLFCD
jgi:hypothetical protein